MKKLLTLVAILFTLNCSAASSIRIPIFSGKHKREARAVRCGSRDTFKRTRKHKVIHAVAMVTTFVALGILMEK